MKSILIFIKHLVFQNYFFSGLNECFYSLSKYLGYSYEVVINLI